MNNSYQNDNISNILCHLDYKHSVTVTDVIAR